MESKQHTDGVTEGSQQCLPRIIYNTCRILGGVPMSRSHHSGSRYDRVSSSRVKLCDSARGGGVDNSVIVYDSDE